MGQYYSQFVDNMLSTSLLGLPLAHYTTIYSNINSHAREKLDPLYSLLL